MRRIVAIAWLLATPLFAQSSPSLQDLSFLVGSWQSVGGPPGANGGSEFHYDVQGKVLVRANHAAYPAAGGRPASTHDDLLILFREEGSPIRGIYFDNEGHVIRYVATLVDGGHLILESEAAAGQPRYQLSYTSAGERLVGEFASAASDKPEHFVPMFKWELKRANR